ncbi:hypothetical protein BpHYR1_050841 [Brachionus plicatilis]|uniref:Uncharacterized protein n=1 Tax=Brachionus plicatilis TaxID=10195 RepID=A0A3M7PAZ4_BRAPC|nr:hypothetical protein BpHYR1_050841 [Brachionus plicatilis]
MYRSGSRNFPLSSSSSLFIVVLSLIVEAVSLIVESKCDEDFTLEPRETIEKNSYLNGNVKLSKKEKKLQYCTNLYKRIPSSAKLYNFLCKNDFLVIN